MTTAALKSIATGEAQQQLLAEMKPKEQIAYLLKQKAGEISKMLPKHLNAERLMKVAQVAATTTPDLAKCDIASLVGAIGQCAQMGLEPNTVLGHAYLVPFNVKRKDANGVERWVNSVQVIIGYKGLIDLARRSGQIVSIAAHEVCEADRFELVYGLDEKLNHTPAMGDRGEVIGFYAVAKLKDGGHCFEFMSRSQAETIRDGSQGYQRAVKWGKQASHPWSAHFVEMGRKTVIRRLAKFLPLSVEFQTGVALDDMAASGKDQRNDSMDGDYSILPDDAPEVTDYETGEISQPAQIEHQQPAMTIPQQTRQTQRATTARAEKESTEAPTMTYADVADKICKAKNESQLDDAALGIQFVGNVEMQAELESLYRQRREQLAGQE